MTSADDVAVEADVTGAGGGAGAPGVSMCPAKTEPASVRLRIIAALSRRRVFITVPPER